MDNLEFAQHIQTEIHELQHEEKNEIMNYVGQFILNPKIQEIHNKIIELQNQCPHPSIKEDRCEYCNKHIN